MLEHLKHTLKALNKFSKNILYNYVRHRCEQSNWIAILFLLNDLIEGFPFNEAARVMSNEKLSELIIEQNGDRNWQTVEPNENAEKVPVN